MLSYRPPSLDALVSRRAFHSCSKLNTESTTEWFARVAESVSGCEFDDISDIMLIDKFLSGFDETIFKQILKEFSIDATRALQIALTSESRHKSNGDFFVKVEVEEDHQDHQVNNCESIESAIENIKTHIYFVVGNRLELVRKL